MVVGFALFVKKAVFLVAAQLSARNSWKVYGSWHVVLTTFYVNVITEDKFDPTVIQLPFFPSFQQFFSEIHCN